MSGRIIFTAGFAAVVSVLLIWRLYSIIGRSDFYRSVDLSAPREVTVVRSEGDILDRKGRPLVNRTERYIAVIDPETADREVLSAVVSDIEKYSRCIDGTALFLCEVSVPEIDGVTVIPVKNRCQSDDPAEHIIGYTNEEHGVSGIECSCDKTLRNPKSTVTLCYRTDASGDLIEGSGLTMRYLANGGTDVLLSVDSEIQHAAEEAMKDVKKGAAVVVDIKTGDICAVVSKPFFDRLSPAESLDDEDAPFINRAFSPYSVGSVFKLVTAGAALEYGISDEYTSNCTGSVMVRMNEFGCHRFGGHGELDMRKAMVESCNPYFIKLGQNIPTDFLHDFADTLGFGHETVFCDDIISRSGYLPASAQLYVPEEKANFCFGQGMLTATPFQVSMLTAAIANDGEMPEPRLVIAEGISSFDASEVYDNTKPSFRRVMNGSTAAKLRSFMISTMYKDNSAAVPAITTAGGKTSTAQTWTYNEYGTEKMNCWFTGFFPAISPEYAVTVMIEEGVSGNYTCGPVFKEIADSVASRRYAGM